MSMPRCEKGELKFTSIGKKLRGSWVLVRTKLGYGGSKKPQWLLIKHRDRYASTEDILTEEAALGAYQSLLAEIARDEGGDVAEPRRAIQPKAAVRR